MLLPDGSFREKFGSFSGQEQALHRSHRFLDWFDRLRRVFAALQVVCNLFGRPRPCWYVGLGSSSTSTYFLATSLEKAKRIKNQSTSNMGGNDGAATDMGDKTSPFNEANMIFPQSMDELPDELRQKLQAKLDADVKAFLESCTKNRHDKVTRFREPSYGDATASESSGAEEKGNGKAKYDEEVNTDAYPTHANFAQMLIDERKLHSNNLQHLSNLLQARMDKLEGKTTDCDQSGAVQQPQFGMPLNFYENQTSHASASQFQSAPSASETDKAGQPGASTST